MSDSLLIETSPADGKLQRLLHRFALAAVAHNSAMEAMDAERAGNQARMLSGLYDALMDCGVIGAEKLLELAESSEPVVAGMAAVYSIRYESSRALAVLRRMAKEPGLLGYRSEMAVERWESGTWEN